MAFLDQGCKFDAELHALEVFPQESCGLIVDGRYWPCRNIADDPCADFVIAPADYASAALRGKVEAIVHSHPNGGGASECDQQSCTGLGLPWYIWSMSDGVWLNINP